LIAQVLNLRAEHAELFRHGSYQALEVLGEQAHNVLAFALEHEWKHAIVIVPIRCATLLENSAVPQVDALRWGDTRVVLPFDASDTNLKGLFQSSAVTKNRELKISDALGDVPVNLFIQHLT
jgi:(1->4)-alpha-D-glucan 1-alpha-D-glucosylmutase